MADFPAIRCLESGEIYQVHSRVGAGEIPIGGRRSRRRREKGVLISVGSLPYIILPSLLHSNTHYNYLLTTG